MVDTSTVKDGIRAAMVSHLGTERPLGDAFRLDLAVACARWINGGETRTGPRGS